MRHSRSSVAIQLICIGSLLAGAVGCVTPPRGLRVMATAYNSVPEQTDGQPNIGAWGDRLQPGMKVIAVSRDLIELGLTHGVEVEIDGLPGRYRVLDKMASRWRRKIDIYMGLDVGAAKSWGRREVTLRWSRADNYAGR